MSNLKPFKKGESGNPAGKPKGTRNRSTIVREWMEAMERAKNPITGEVEELTQADNRAKGRKADRVAI